MKDLVLLRRYPDADTKGTGVGSYLDMMESIFDINGIDVNRVYFKLSTDEGYIKCFKQGYIQPLKELKGEKYQLYHATDELCCLNFPKIKGKKIVTFHHVAKDREGHSVFLFPIWNIAAKRAIKYSDAIISVSQQTKNELVKQLGADPDKIYVLSHTVDPMFRDLGILREKLIGFVGTLIERKNVAAGLRAFKKFTGMPGTEGFRFVICGEGPLKEELISLSKSLGIDDRVDFVYGLHKNGLLELYNKMAVFANTSMHEGLGLTPLEAQACGTPVVYFKDAYIPSQFTEYFLPSGDEDEFARNMYKLVTDNEFRSSIINRVPLGLGQEDYAKKLFKIYSEVLGTEFP